MNGIMDYDGEEIFIDVFSDIFVYKWWKIHSRVLVIFQFYKRSYLA